MRDAPHSRRARRVSRLAAFLGLLGVLHASLATQPSQAPTQEDPGQKAAVIRNPERLFLWVPDTTYEGAGLLPEPGRVFLSQPAPHDLEILLSAGPLVSVPSSVTLPAGHHSTTFPIRVSDDTVLSRVGRTMPIRATTDTLPAAERPLRIHDNEPPSPSFLLPEALVEGSRIQGTVRLDSPRDYDEVITFQAAAPLVVNPDSLRIPAGSLEAGFTVLATDDASLNGPRPRELCYVMGDYGGTCLTLLVLDNEVAPDRLEPPLPPAVFAGEPLPITLRLIDSLGSISRTNATGRASLSPPLHPGLATFSPQPFPLAFSNGIFSGDLHFEGVALQAGIGVEVAGRTFTAGAVDILQGHTVQGPFADLTALPGSGKLLVLGGGTTNAAQELIEISADTGATLRRLTLPRAAQRIAVSDSGATGWCASPEGTLQQVDLRDWRLGEEFRIAPSDAQARTLSLAVLTGTEDQLVLLLDTNRPNRINPFQVVAVNNGVRRTRTASVAFSSLPGHLIAGRTSAEALADASGRLHAFDIRDDGVVLRESATASLGINQTQPNLVRLGDTLFRGSGETWSISPLRRLTQSPETRGPNVALASEDRILAYLQPTGEFRVFDRVSGLLRGSHRVPWPAAGGVPPRFLISPSDAFAALTPDRDALLLWRSPLLDPQPADVGVLAFGSPQIIANPTNDLNLSAATDWTWTVTNRGPGVAHGITLTLDSGLPHIIPSLEPGGTRVFADRRLLRPPGILRGTATLTAATGDPNPDNNRAALRSEMVAPTLPGFRHWLPEARDLARSADGQRLWVAVAPPVAEGGPGVLELDPATGSVTRLLSTDRDVLRLRPSPDGRFLYLRIAHSEVLRWNLGTREFDLRLNFGAETVTDVLPLPGTERSFVVSTSQRVVVYDDTVARPRELIDTAERRHLCHAAGRVWLAQPGRLSRARIVADGLEQEGDSLPFDVPDEAYEITTDDRRLFFPWKILELDTLRIVPLPFPGPLCPEPSLGLLYIFTGAELSRLDLPSLNSQVTQTLPGSDQVPVRLVRWGVDGFAILHRSGLLGILRSPVVAEPGGGDVDVRIVPPIAPEPFVTQSWFLSVTNHSEVPVRNVHLVLNPIGALEFARSSDNSLEDFYRLQNQNLGSLPPHGSISVEVPIRLSTGRYDLIARVLSSSQADLFGDNETRLGGDIEPPEGDLALDVQTPTGPVEAGAVFPVRVRVTHSAAATLHNLRLQLTPYAGLRIVSAEPGTLEPVCCGPQAQLDLGNLAAGSSIDVLLRLQSSNPGIARFDLQAQASVRETNITNNHASRLVAIRGASSPDGFALFDFPAGVSVWSEARRQVASVFQGHPALVLLDPQGVSLQREIPLPTPATRLALSHNGTFAWVALEGGDVAQVRIDEGTLVRRFPTREPVGAETGSLATLPGDPNLLVVGGNNTLPTASIGAYRDGIPLPDRIEGLESHLAGVFLHATAGGRLFATTGRLLRELRVTPTGLTEVRNLDSLTRDFPSLSSTARHLVFASGRFLDLETFAPVDLAAGDFQVVADPTTSVAYQSRFYRTQSDDSPLWIAARGPGSPETLWRMTTPRDVSGTGPVSRAVTLGDQGLLLTLNSQALRVGTHAPGNPEATLGIDLRVPNPLAVVGALNTVHLTVFQSGPWAAREAMLEVEVSDGLQIVEPAVSLVNGRGTLPLGTLHETNRALPFILRPTRAGDAFFKVRVRSSLPDTHPANDTAEWRVNVLDAPLLLLDDLTVAEGSNPQVPEIFSIPLSSPAPQDAEIPYRLILLSAGSDDLLATEGILYTQRGLTAAHGNLVRGDTRPETDTTFRLELLASPLPTIRTSAVVTIANDDLPQVSVQFQNVREGNSGITLAAVPILLDPPAPFPVDVSYRVESDTATAGIDFLAQSGSLRFQPGEQTNVINVQVLGDADFEPAEFIRIRLTEAASATWTQPTGTVQILNDDPPPAPTITLTRPTEQTWRVQFDTLPGVRYLLQSREGPLPGPWIPQSTPVVGNGQPASIPAPVSASKTRFFRIRAD